MKRKEKQTAKSVIFSLRPGEKLELGEKEILSRYFKRPIQSINKSPEMMVKDGRILFAHNSFEEAAAFRSMLEMRGVKTNIILTLKERK